MFLFLFYLLFLLTSLFYFYYFIFIYSYFIILLWWLVFGNWLLWILFIIKKIGLVRVKLTNSAATQAQQWGLCSLKNGKVGVFVGSPRLLFTLKSVQLLLSLRWSLVNWGLEVGCSSLHPGTFWSWLLLRYSHCCVPHNAAFPHSLQPLREM